MRELELFILGAGFTRAFNPLAPLMYGFLEGREDFLSNNRFREIVAFVEDCKLQPIGSINIEHLLTLAWSAKPWENATERLHSQVLKEELRDLINHVLFKAFKWIDLGGIYKFIIPDESAIRKFARHLLENKNAHVITFNYDTLLENYLELIKTEIHRQDPSKPYHECDFRFSLQHSYGFRGLMRMHQDIISPENSLYTTIPNRSMQFLKLHGSLMWFARKTYGQPVFPGDVLLESCHLGRPPYEDAPHYFENLPLIIPPILDKSTEIERPLISLIWGRAAELIGGAVKIVFVGYSFPSGDSYAEYLFRKYTKAYAKIEVVLKADNLDEAKSCMRRYRQVFPDLDDSAFRFDGAEKFCNQFEPDKP